MWALIDRRERLALAGVLDLETSPIKYRLDVSHSKKMEPEPPPPVPGNTDAERMSNALSMVLTVSKKDLLKKEA